MTPLSCSWTFVFPDTQQRQSFIGDTVHLQCREPKPSNSGVDWIYQRSPNTKARRIISGGHLTNGNRGGRLNISGSTLIINNVKNHDSGTYTCVEDAGLGKNHYVNLTVQGK